MIIKFNNYNESLRDQMLSKSDDEILNKLDKMKSTDALIKAIDLGYLDGVKKIYKENDFDQSWLDYGERRAAQEGFVDIMKFFINKGANNHNISLYTAYWNGQIEAFKYLLEQGADITTISTTDVKVYLTPKQEKEFHKVFREYGIKESKIKMK